MGIGITVSKVLEFFFLHLLHTCLKSQHCNTKTVSQQTVLAKVINFAVNIKEIMRLVIGLNHPSSKIKE